LYIVYIYNVFVIDLQLFDREVWIRVYLRVNNLLIVIFFYLTHVKN